MIARDEQGRLTEYRIRDGEVEKSPSLTVEQIKSLAYAVMEGVERRRLRKYRRLKRIRLTCFDAQIAGDMATVKFFCRTTFGWKSKNGRRLMAYVTGDCRLPVRPPFKFERLVCDMETCLESLLRDLPVVFWKMRRLDSENPSLSVEELHRMVEFQPTEFTTCPQPH